MDHRHIEVHPVPRALGAEVDGVDSAQPLPDEVVAEGQRPPGAERLLHRVASPGPDTW